jgi:cobalt-zinc-cadmium efflux system outer membrane protein
MPEKPGRKQFDLPTGLPGADASPINPPRFAKDTPLEVRDKAVHAAYPELRPVVATALQEVPADNRSYSLAELQQIALEASPVIRRAEADATAAFGTVVQAGLYPNPTVGYDATQVPYNGVNNGQIGAVMSQIIKTGGKLSLAQQVAGFDYLNAQVALRRSQLDVIHQVRTSYFQALVAQKGVQINKALVALADEVYELELKQLVAGESAGYEPLQLYTQAVQARNNLLQAEWSFRSNMKQLLAALGRPDLPPSLLDGRADAMSPVFDQELARSHMLEAHTDVLTARNTILQAQTNLLLQRRTRIPDLQTKSGIHWDDASGAWQYDLGVGVALPLFDRNQGHILQAEAKVGRANENLSAVENQLLARFADAFGRYEANRAIVENYRDRILPNLARAYRAIIRRYQSEPEKVGFNDIVVAQQNLAGALQAYLSALSAQWQAAVDAANLIQTDDLYLMPAAPCDVRTLILVNPQ